MMQPAGGGACFCLGQLGRHGREFGSATRFGFFGAHRPSRLAHFCAFAASECLWRSMPSTCSVRAGSTCYCCHRRASSFLVRLRNGRGYAQPRCCLTSGCARNAASFWPGLAPEGLPRAVTAVWRRSLRCGQHRSARTCQWLGRSIADGAAAAISARLLWCRRTEGRRRAVRTVSAAGSPRECGCSLAPPAAGPRPHGSSTGRMLGPAAACLAQA